ncbi:hypothetical protein BDZ91DRAFT_371892 [Kalaharituber pfeilii]|nr:hypothetical protein BDZ91DRAFT_371892 [Kalaharituber pfeilii]
MSAALGTTNPPVIIDNVTPEDFIEWQCRYPGLRESREGGLYEYDSIRKKFVVNALSTSVHQAFGKVFSRSMEFQLREITQKAGLGPDEAGIDVEVESQCTGFSGHKSMASTSKKTPDASVKLLEPVIANLKGSLQAPKNISLNIPTIAVEVAFTQRFDDAQRDARLFLLRTGCQTHLAMVLDIREAQDQQYVRREDVEAEDEDLHKSGTDEECEGVSQKRLQGSTNTRKPTAESSAGSLPGQAQDNCLPLLCEFSAPPR